MRNFTVLLVEDDAPLRRSLVELLAAQGWLVHSTGNGADAIDLARACRPDFSLLDMHLPGMTGLEILRALQREFNRPIPSIMMSGAASPAEAHAAISEGVFRFLHKPLDLASFRASIQLLIQHHFPFPTDNPESPGRPPS